MIHRSNRFALFICETGNADGIDLPLRSRSSGRSQERCPQLCTGWNYSRLTRENCCVRDKVCESVCKVALSNHNLSSRHLAAKRPIQSPGISDAVHHYPSTEIDSAEVGLINNGETIDRSGVSLLTKWCKDNNLHLNLEKTKEIIVDFKRQHGLC